MARVMSIIAALMLSASPAAADVTVPITVDVSGVDGGGLMLCKLFAGERGWPESNTTPIARQAVKIENGRARCVFEAAPGRYAVAVAHDANSNYEIDTNVVGIPTEGFGFSNGAEVGLFGPPDYEDALFPVRGATVQRIRVAYF